MKKLALPLALSLLALTGCSGSDETPEVGGDGCPPMDTSSGIVVKITGLPTQAVEEGFYQDPRKSSVPFVVDFASGDMEARGNGNFLPNVPATQSGALITDGSWVGFAPTGELPLGEGTATIRLFQTPQEDGSWSEAGAEYTIEKLVEVKLSAPFGAGCPSGAPVGEVALTADDF